MERIDKSVRIFMGIKIKEYRKRMRLTQNVFASMVKAAHNTEASWEKGEREPSMAQLYMIAKITGAGVSEFFPPLVDEEGQVMEKELITDFRNLNDQGQTLAAAAVKGLSQMPEYRKVDRQAIR